MLIIDFEAHFLIQPCLDYLLKRKQTPYAKKGVDAGSYNINFTKLVSLYHPKFLIDNLLDIADKRLALMDQAQVDLQILSLTTPSGIDSVAKDAAIATSLAHEANDVLYEAIQKNPHRFKGFAALSPYDVNAAIKELERTIKLGFVGWLTHSNFGDNDYLDNKKYWPILEAAEGLNTPIYLHPTVPRMKEFGEFSFALGGSAFGFEVDTALCAMRMILAGVFDQFPQLKIIIGHLGESLPFFNERLDHMYRADMFKNYRPAIKKWPSEVLKNNFYITPSGRFCQDTLRYVLAIMGNDHLLFATDFPYESMEESVKFITQSNLPQQTIEKICSKNAIDLGFISIETKTASL